MKEPVMKLKFFILMTLLYTNITAKAGARNRHPIRYNRAITFSLLSSFLVSATPLIEENNKICEYFCPLDDLSFKISCCDHRSNLFYEPESKLTREEENDISNTVEHVIQGIDDRVPADVNDFPIQAIGKVWIKFNKSTTQCTGSLIGPNIIITNMHCITHKGVVAKPDKIKFAPAYDHGSEYDAVGQYCIMPKDYIDSKFTNDWVIVVLNKRLADKYGQFEIKNLNSMDYQTAPINESSVKLVGYSRGKYSNDPAGNFNCQILGTTNKDSRGYYRVKHDCDSESGTSGSPIWQLEDGEASIVALHNAAHPNYNLAVPSEFFYQIVQEVLKNPKFKVSPLQPQQGSCLPDDAKILDKDHNPINIAKLTPGEPLLGPRNSTLYFHDYNHHDHKQFHKFIQFETDSNHKLSLSEDHVVYIKFKDHQIATRAKTAQIKHSQSPIFLPMVKGGNQTEPDWHQVKFVKEVYLRKGITSFLTSTTLPNNRNQAAQYQEGKIGIHVLSQSKHEVAAFLISPTTIPNEALYYQFFNLFRLFGIYTPNQDGQIIPPKIPFMAKVLRLFAEEKPIKL